MVFLWLNKQVVRNVENPLAFAANYFEQVAFSQFSPLRRHQTKDKTPRKGNWRNVEEATCVM